MKEYLFKIRKTWLAWLRLRRQQRDKVRRHREKVASSEAVQVMEFNGKTYVCHDGVPLVETGMLNMPVTTVLDSARRAWLLYGLFREAAK